MSDFMRWTRMATKTDLARLRQDMQEGFAGIYAELHGRKDAIKPYRQASRLEYAAPLKRIAQREEGKQSGEAKL